jgi:hypothetical protein
MLLDGKPSIDISALSFARFQGAHASRVHG